MGDSLTGYGTLVQSQRRLFLGGVSRSEPDRRARLAALLRTIEAREPELLAALREDLGKGETDAYASEIAPVLGEIRHALRHLGAWMRPR